MTRSARPIPERRLRPPMGWNSWDCYGTTVTEDEVLANATFMHDHLLAHGWDTVVVDIQWAVCIVKLLVAGLVLTGCEIEGDVQVLAAVGEVSRLRPRHRRLLSAAAGPSDRNCGPWCPGRAPQRALFGDFTAPNR